MDLNKMIENVRLRNDILETLRAWGYDDETTLYEIEFDTEGLKDKIETIKDYHGITKMTPEALYPEVEE